MLRLWFLSGIVRRLSNLPGYSMLLVTISAFLVDYRSAIAAMQQFNCDGASTLIANVS